MGEPTYAHQILCKNKSLGECDKHSYARKERGGECKCLKMYGERNVRGEFEIV